MVPGQQIAVDERQTDDRCHPAAQDIEPADAGRKENADEDGGEDHGRAEIRLQHDQAEGDDKDHHRLQHVPEVVEVASPVVRLRNELGEGHQQNHLPQLRGLEGARSADLIPPKDAAGVHFDHQEQDEQAADDQIRRFDEGLVLVVIEKGDGHGHRKGDEDAHQLAVEVFHIQPA